MTKDERHPKVLRERCPPQGNSIVLITHAALNVYVIVAKHGVMESLQQLDSRAIIRILTRTRALMVRRVEVL